MLFITGITGHSGRYFYQTLLEQQYKGKIRLLVRKSSDISFLSDSPLEIEVVYGELEDQQFVESVLSGVEAIFHITNIRYTPGIIDAALKAGITRVIAVHTTGIFSKFRDASAEYQNIESELAEIVESQPDLKLTILRPTMIYGDLWDRNISKFIRMMDRYRIFPVIEGGKALIQPVNARDLGRAYYDVLQLSVDKTRSEYILSGESAISMMDCFRMMGTFLGKKTYFVSCPVALGVVIASVTKWFTLCKLDYVEKVQRMTEDRSFSHECAAEDFGYKPQSFEEGLMREVKAYQEQKKKNKERG